MANPGRVNKITFPGGQGLIHEYSSDTVVTKLILGAIFSYHLCDILFPKVINPSDESSLDKRKASKARNFLRNAMPTLIAFAFLTLLIFGRFPEDIHLLLPVHFLFLNWRSLYRWIPSGLGSSVRLGHKTLRTFLKRSNLW